MMKKLLEKKLRFFAKRIVRKYRPQVIGVTGSVGKTSAKEAIFAVLKNRANIRQSEGNYNNELGVPLTVIGAASGGRSPLRWLSVFAKAKMLWLFRDTNYPAILLLEMGADHPGDIAYLTDMAPCDIGIVTAVAPAHTEFFGSFEKVIEEKSTLVKRLGEKGIAILNYDDANAHAMSKETRAHIMTYGFENGAIVRAAEPEVEFEEREMGTELGKIRVPSGIHFQMFYKDESATVHLGGVLGKAHAYAALAGVAVGIVHHLSLTDIARALEDEYLPPRGRMRIVSGIRSTTLIDDTYNSSPVAALAALEVLRNIPATEETRRIAVLGDMLELGSYAEEGHRAVGKAVAEKKLDALFAVGNTARFIADEAKARGMAPEKVFVFSKAEDAGKFLQDYMDREDIVLIKGSQGARMEKVVKEVMAEPLRASELLVRQGKEWMK